LMRRQAKRSSGWRRCRAVAAPKKLDSFWCEMGEQTTVEVDSSIGFGL
jgi:hypothetical protein